MNHDHKYDLETLRVIQREKELELLASHEELFIHEIKKIDNLEHRSTLLRVYKMLMSWKNIEYYYNLPMIKFMSLFYNAEIELIKKPK